VFAALIRAGLDTARDPERARATLTQVIERDDVVPSASVIARYRRGQLAGPRGEAERHQAEQWLREQGVRDPDRFAAMSAPGAWAR
jgi:hypothetical protein